MQFGHTFNRVLHRIHHANRRFGPVYMIKVDIADGFYQLKVATAHIPALGVAFPSLPGEELMVAFPLVLPMGWVSSPPYFCALTETAADLANTLLRNPFHVPMTHRLSTRADTACSYQPVSRRPLVNRHLAPQAVPLPPADIQPLAFAAPALPTSSCSEVVTRTGDRIPHLPPPHVASLGVPVPPQQQPHQQYCAATPLAYVDLYMDDFLGLAQGHPHLRERVRPTLLHSIDKIFRPLSPGENSGFRRDPISHTKLDKGDAKWATRKCLLGWIIDSVAETVELPLHRSIRLLDILKDLQSKRRVSLKNWQQAIGELRSMVLALPGGQGLFSMLYTGLSQSCTKQARVRLTKPIHDALSDLQYLADNIASRPTRIGELVQTLPVAYGTADACGIGMGGIWFSPDPTFQPIVWREPFAPEVQQQLLTDHNAHGTITNSDLELAAQIAEQDILVQIRSCQESTISTFTDNISARAWQRKGSKSTLGPAAYLLRLHSLHQRHYRYYPTIDYLPGPINTMADDASRLWHLSDSALLLHFNSLYKQPQPWKLLTLRPTMNSALTMSLLCKRSKPELFLHVPVLEMPPGFSGLPTAPVSPLTPCFPMWPTPSLSSKSSLPAIGVAKLPPAAVLSDLVPWKQPSARLARRWPAWGPRTFV
jgi:hypothetical protein